ncbi:alpha-glucosidase/alpha-galactosidase [Streptomyces sp. NPDC087856]|uniref:family 4 glycosyl hydrolase n=1 Tax=Streptomyces sp. NPDC087856 TaxID=3365811 RepID=UPI003819B617
MPGATSIVLTGAGNVELTRRILADLFTVPELRGTLRIVLHDIDPGRLATAEELAARLNTEAGAGARVEVRADRRRALDGADFVVCQLSVGDYQTTLRDFEIPHRHGLRQTIGDSIGVGGIFRGLRTIPVLVALAQDMTEVCPEAWLLSYTDPLVMTLWAIRKATGQQRLAGLCHGVRDTHAFLADTVGRDVEEVSFFTAGITHQAFVLRFEADGHSLYPEFARAALAHPTSVRTRMWRSFGFFPTESSEHAAEYVPWFMRYDAEIARHHIPVGEYLSRVGQNLHGYEEVRRALAATGSLLNRWREPEVASVVMTAMLTARPARLNLTVPNDGLIAALPQETVVEVPCRVDQEGITPTVVETYPVQLAALNRTYLNVAELTVHAALEGSRAHVDHAAMLDPNTAAALPLAEIHDLCDEMIEAHRELLPAGITAGTLGGADQTTEGKS